MLAKKNRLSGAENFKKVESEGRMFQSANFGLAILDRGDTGPSRFGFIVSSKISKNATDRNAIKRRIRESLRLLLTETKEGLDVVFLAKTSSLRASSEQIMKEVRAAVKDSGIVK